MNNIDYYLDFKKMHEDARERLSIAKNPKQLSSAISKAKIRVRFIESSVVFLDENEKEIKTNSNESIELLDDFFDEYFCMAIQELFPEISEKALSLMEIDEEYARLSASDEIQELEKDIKNKKAIINGKRGQRKNS